MIETDDLFRVVAGSARDGIVSIDEDSTILFANASTERIFGYGQQELVGHSLTKLMPDYLRHLHEAALERYVATGEKHVHWGGVELPGKHRDGNEIPLEISFGETSESGRRLFTGIIRDVSERTRLRRRFEAQYEISKILARGDSLERATLDILETICTCLDWQVGIVWKPDESGLLHAVRSWHDPTFDVEAFLNATRAHSMQPGVGVPGRVSSSRQPLWVPDLDLEENYPRKAFAHQAGLRASFAFPISSGDELLGVMEFYSSVVREPDVTVLNLIKSTAAQIGQFVQRKRAQEELKLLNHELEHRVLERTAQLRETNEELESFVYSVSHDLRAPLRGIDGFSQLLLDDFGKELGDSAASYLLRIRGAASRMGELIDDLLELSRISRTELRKKAVDLSAIAKQVIQGLEQEQPDRQVNVAIAPGLEAYGDPGLLRIVVENLLENAWKFTAHATDPRIEVGASGDEGRQVFCVRDNGAGFDMAFADKLFKPFQRLHSADEFAGTGIGLTTVQRIVQRHGGSVWVEAAEGKGATFYFHL